MCGAPQFGGRDKQLGNVHGTARLDENSVKPHDDCTSVHDAIHKEGTAPSSTHKPLAVELAIFEITGHGRRSRLEVDRLSQIAVLFSPSAHRGSTTRDNNK